MKIHLRAAAGAAFVLALTTCTGELPTSSDTQQLTSTANVCPDFCDDVDPAPSAPGIFIGHALTPSFCFNGPFNDIDQDGLNDYCETMISYFFRPELKYWSVDDTRGEPYWVARSDSSGHVFVGYLISYYRDGGSSAWGCHVPILIFAPPDPSCGGHNGDSESIWLLIAYNASTEHWILNSAYYSAHTSWNYSTYNAASGYAALEYPGQLGGYPRAWVSEGKHANYFSNADCNDQIVGTCSNANTSTRLEWSNSFNIGSQTHPLINEVPSRNSSYEYYGSGRTECYWNERHFRGWTPEYVNGAESSSYLSKLSFWGFSTSTGATSGCGQGSGGGGGGGQSGLTVNITGQNPVQPYSGCLFQALPAGGSGPYSYAWTQDGTAVGDDSPSYRASAGTDDFVLGVTVTDSGGLFGSNTFSVYVRSEATMCLDQ